MKASSWYTTARHATAPHTLDSPPPPNQEIAEVIKREYLSMQNIREMHWKEGYKGVVRKDTKTEPAQEDAAKPQ